MGSASCGLSQQSTDDFPVKHVERPGISKPNADDFPKQQVERSGPYLKTIDDFPILKISGSVSPGLHDTFPNGKLDDLIQTPPPPPRVVIYQD